MHRPSVREAARILVVFLRVILRLELLSPPVSNHFRRNRLVVLAMQPVCVESMINLMDMYIYSERQSAHIVHAVCTRPP
jgi:hypothetical protein